MFAASISESGQRLDNLNYVAHDNFCVYFPGVCFWCFSDFSSEMPINRFWDWFAYPKGTYSVCYIALYLAVCYVAL